MLTMASHRLSPKPTLADTLAGMDTPLAERMLTAFLEQMIRTEAVDPDDISEAADRLDLAGDEEAAHALRCIIVKAAAPDQSEWEAERARARFHVIDGNGGKSED